MEMSGGDSVYFFYIETNSDWGKIFLIFHVSGKTWTELLMLYLFHRGTEQFPSVEELHG